MMLLLLGIVKLKICPSSNFVGRSIIFPPECFFNVCLPGIENAAVFLFQGQVNVLQAFFFCMAVAVNVVLGLLPTRTNL